MNARALLVVCTAVAACFMPAAAESRAVWYIKPTPNSLCPQDGRCYTFYQILHNATVAEAIFSSNTILVFLSGDHVLKFEAEAFLQIRSLENFTLLGSPDRVSSKTEITRPASRIVCMSRFAMAFINASGLSFTNLTFSNCGANLTEELAVEAFSTQTHGIHYFGPEQKAAFLLLNIQTFKMVSCVIETSHGYGLLGVNLLGNSSVRNSVFHMNNNYTTSLDRCRFFPGTVPDDITACSGGNALFVFEDLPQCPSTEINYTFKIFNSVFTLGVNGFGGRLPDKYLTRGAGLGIVLAQSSYGVTITIDNIVSYGNSALIGANIYLAMYETVDNSSIVLQNSTTRSANGGLLSVANIFEESGSSSGGLHVDYNLPIIDHRSSVTAPVCNGGTKHQEEILSITNCAFLDNVAILGAGAFIIIRASADSEYVARFRIEDCIFSSNVGTSGMALYISQEETLLRGGTSRVTFERVNIIANTYVTPIRELTELYTNFQLNAVQLVRTDSVSFTDSFFSRNEGSALSAFGSQVFMFNSVQFEHNSGIEGGAINLENSHLFFAPYTRITFQDNYALVHGGAINVIGRSDVISACFFQVLDPSFLENPNVTLYFEGNYAEDAGNVLYGGSVDRCIVSTHSSLDTLASTKVFDYLVDIANHDTSTSLISSNSITVCTCVDDIPHCPLRSTMVSVPPGATFEFSFVTVGQRGGVTPSTVYVVAMERNMTLGQFQQAQKVGKTCTKLNFTINTGRSNTSVVVRTGDLAVNGSFTFNISVLPCPLGFVVNASGVCACDPVAQFEDVDIDCNINQQILFRNGGSWISPSFSGPNQSYDGLLVVQNCPYDYCNRNSSTLDLMDPDSQCEFNRTGVLCGACKPGFSRTLGSSNCEECSNVSLAFVLVFVMSGFVLVALLFALNLTISGGMLGGIIFYANIVYVNYTSFYGIDYTSFILAIFSFINLDFSLSLCFYDGMDEYARTWLGYTFPFFIWAIVLVIIMASRFSPTIARIFGSKPVPVLATLLLLSFNRILQVVIISLSSTIITYPDGSLHARWTNDGNLGYWKGKHVPLGIFAIGVTLFFIVPYTLLLVVVPLSCIQARSTHRFLSWVNKLKPFLDAHEGPFKSRFRNWTGVLLLVRIFLSTVSSVNVGKYDDDIILLVIATVMFLLIGFGWVSGGGMYKKWPLNVLECSFFLNIGILSLATIYLGQQKEVAIVQTSGSIALIELVGIMVYHAYKQISSLKMVKRWKDACHFKLKNRRHQGELVPSLNANTDSDKSATTTTTVSFSTLRESLLEEETHDL